MEVFYICFSGPFVQIKLLFFLHKFFTGYPPVFHTPPEGVYYPTDPSRLTCSNR